MKCPNCNQKVDAKPNFCNHCGTDLRKLSIEQLMQNDMKEIKEIEKGMPEKKKSRWPFLLLIPIIIAIVFFAYLKKQEIDYDTATNEGIEAISEHKYDEAIIQFEKASLLKAQREEAKQLHKATIHLKSAQELYDEDNLDAALTEINQISEINESVKEEDKKFFDLLNEQTQLLKTKITNLTDKYDDFSEELENAQDSVDLQSEITENELNETIGVLDTILSSEEIMHPYFIKLKEDTESFRFVLNEYYDSFIEFQSHQNEIEEELALYSDAEIEYARIILMLGEPESSVIYVSQSPAGSPVFNHPKADPDVVFPNNIVWLSGEYVPDGFVVYSPIGDGYIDVYPMPYHIDGLGPEKEPEEYREQTLEILNGAERLYVDDADNEVLLEKLRSTTFNY